ncbi:alpha/beta-type small acid-soluble spore protein [Proteiniborus sp. MB09-C3]|uniref:alpha/beta-type small acid-soluble spore protein n=1 Tax=Proteiniborus sp. MB09-C3 TaxID=3050072 RepID=UPI002555D5ED|nr:alpha/beta-type small acid-soluble spore protein [Proteiniborus sp. MB09-C3]WIV12002.1 alpha/beta-type small acid-soluble spore protein [Proteiniborus sp. MB09-C3]
MSKRRLVVPEARNAFEQFKTEIANEYGVDDPKNLAAKHTGVIVRELIAKAEKQLIDKE